jgi:hypothetical protein
MQFFFHIVKITLLILKGSEISLPVWWSAIFRRFPIITGIASASLNASMYSSLPDKTKLSLLIGTKCLSSLYVM